MKYCTKCGNELNDNDTVCSKCNTEQSNRHIEVFKRNGLSEKDFIDNINRWFEHHPNVAKVTCTFDANTTIGLATNHYVLNEFTIEYELFKNRNTNQYALVKEEKFGMVQKSVKDFVGQWKEEHPNATVVNYKGSTHTRGHVGSFLLKGLGGVNRTEAYILYRYKRDGK